MDDEALPETHLATSGAKTPTLTVSKIHGNTTVPIARLIELRRKKLNYDEIAAIVGLSKQAIRERLLHLLPSIDNLDSVKGNRADLFTVIGDTLINSLSEDDIKAASLLQRVTAMGILYDKERLERGQSNINISVVDLTQSLVEITRQREELEAQVVGALQELRSLTDDSEAIDV